MKKIIKLATLFSLLTFAFYSCKKDNQSSADKVAGNYSVVDTTFQYNLPPQCQGGTNIATYGATIQKVTDNSVYLLSFNGCNDTIIASVSSNSIVATVTGGCYDAILGTVSGNKIYFTYAGVMCDSAGRATAIKQ